MADDRTILLKVELDVDQLKKSQKEAADAVDKLTAERKELRDATEKDTIAIAENRVELQKANKQLTNSTKAIKTFEAATKNQNGSLQEMRALLAASKVEFEKLSKEQRESDFGRKAANDMLALKEAINETEQSFGTFTGTVGDYTQAMSKADKETTDLEATFEDINGDVKPLSGRLGELEDRMFELALAGKTNTDEFKDLRAEAVRFRKTIIAVDASVDQLAEQGGALGPALQLGEGVVQGYQAFAGVTALVGDENEELLQILVKLEAAQAVLSALEGAQTALRKNSINITNLQARAQKGLNLAIGNGSKASKAFRGALLATGIGAIILAISLLVENFDALKAAITGSSEAQKTANEIGKAANEAVADQLSALDSLEKSINDVNVTNEERVEIIKDFNKQHPALLAGIDAETASLEDLNNQIAINAKLLTARAELEAIAQKRSETFKEVLDLQTEALTGQDVGLFELGAEFFISGVEAQDLANIATSESINLKEKEISLLDDFKKAKEEEIDLLLQSGAAGEKESKEAEANLKQQEADEKKALSERKKRAKEAEDIAKKLQDILLENIELSNEEQREVLEAHFKFRQEISKDDAGALLILENEKNEALRQIELNELQSSIDRLKVKHQAEIEEAKGNKELLEALEINHLEELNAINREFDAIQEERDRQHVENLIKRNEETKKADQELIDLTEKTSDEIEVIRAQSALDAVRGTEQEIEAFRRLQDAKIALLEETAKQQLENDELVAEEREKIEAQLAADIAAINRESAEQDKADDEKKIEDKRAVAVAITQAAQQLGASLVQIAKNNIQEELNVDKEKFDEQSAILQENFDNNLITQTEFESQKAALENAANQKASALKLKQFKLDKAAALIQAGIDTSLAVIAALRVPPAPNFVTAAIAGTLGGIQTATIASQPTPTFEKGGNPKIGKFGGNLHSSGGTKGVFDDGTQIEVERDEAFFILNRSATATINSLSDHNVAHGGNSFMQNGGVVKFQGGGNAALRASANVENRFEGENRIIQAAAALPAPVVDVQQIIDETLRAVQVKQSGDF